MTSDTVAFRWIEIERFRGFNARQRINLDASAVLVHGPNGTGKTSFFDALQWLLIGSLQRLEKWRVRKNDEHITNLYAGSAPAVESAEMQLGDRIVHLRRQGRFNEGLLEWNSADGSSQGEEAERLLRQALTSRPGQDVRRMLMTSALLQQDEVREVLEDKPSERYQQLAAMLGLDELAGFEAAAKRRAERLSTAGREARAALETAQGKADRLKKSLDLLLSDIRLADDVREARERILTRLRDLSLDVRVTQEPSTSAEAALLQQSAEAMGLQLVQLQARRAELAARRSKAVDPDEGEATRREGLVLNAQTTVDEAQASLTVAQQRLADATERSDQEAALAAKAIDLLGETCPVCGQSIDAHDVRETLHSRLNRERSSDLSRIVDEVEKVRASLSKASEELERRQLELGPFLNALREAQQLKSDERQWEDDIAAFSPPPQSVIDVIELDDIRSGKPLPLSNALVACVLSPLRRQNSARF